MQCRSENHIFTVSICSFLNTLMNSRGLLLIFKFQAWIIVKHVKTKLQPTEIYWSTWKKSIILYLLYPFVPFVILKWILGAYFNHLNFKPGLLWNMWKQRYNPQKPIEASRNRTLGKSLWSRFSSISPSYDVVSKWSFSCLLCIYSVE